MRLKLASKCTCNTTICRRSSRPKGAGSGHIEELLNQAAIVQSFDRAQIRNMGEWQGFHDHLRARTYHHS